MDAAISAPQNSHLQFEWKTLEQSPEQSELITSKQNLEYITNDPMYNTIRKAVLPYVNLQSRFKLQDALKLAEIDSKYHICPRSSMYKFVPSLIQYRSDLMIDTIDMGGGPAGFTEYIQFRYVNAMTIGMKKTWDIQVIDRHRIIPIYGSDYSGDVSKQWKDFNLAVQSQFVAGVDFGSGVSDSDYMSIVQLYLLAQNLKDGASAILQIQTTWTQIMMEMIYVATQLFQKVVLFQPLVSGSDSNEIFLVLRIARSERLDHLVNLKSLIDSVPNDKSNIKGFVKTKIPEKFIDQYNQIKKEFLELQIETLSEIQNYLRILDIQPKQNIDIANKLAEWALPDSY